MGEEGSGVSPWPLAVTSNGRVQSRGELFLCNSKTPRRKQGQEHEGV